MTMIEVALSYASEGYQVFPCKPRSKDPAVKWREAATTDEEQIRSWWNREPEYNIGLPTGEVNGFWALDVDGSKGRESLTPFLGEIPHDTPRVNTGNGYHLYFKHVGDNVPTNAGVMAEGLDVRGDGGFVVAAGSVHESGKAYEYSNDSREPTGAPESLLTALRDGVRQRGPVSFQRPIPEGSRNYELTRIGGRLTRMGVDSKTVKRWLHEVNEDQCKPPLHSDEVDGITLYENQVSLSPSPKHKDSRDTLPGIRRIMDITPPSGERPFIVDGVLFRGFAGAIYGDGGTAKSYLMMHMAQCVARGQKWGGFDTVQTNVLYLDFELDGEEQSRRAHEIAAGMGHDGPPESFYYLSGAGFPARAIFDHALESCKEHNIGMVVVDSLGYALEGDAEASRDVLRFFREVEGSYRREGISLQIVDHQSKNGNYQDKTMFGSVYKSNSTRSVFQVEPSEHGDGYINLTLRHRKVNFGPKLEPFGIRVTFESGKVKIEERALDAAELVGEGTLNSKDRVYMALADGPLYPHDIAEVTGLELKTVKNALTTLRKDGAVEYTGNKDYRNSNEVRQVSLLSLPLEDEDKDTYEETAA